MPAVLVLSFGEPSEFRRTPRLQEQPFTSTAELTPASLIAGAPSSTARRAYRAEDRSGSWRSGSDASAGCASSNRTGHGVGARRSGQVHRTRSRRREARLPRLWAAAPATVAATAICGSQWDHLAFTAAPASSRSTSTAWPAQRAVTLRSWRNVQLGAQRREFLTGEVDEFRWRRWPAAPSGSRPRRAARAWISNLVVLRRGRSARGGRPDTYFTPSRRT